MKTCKICQKELPETEFYHHPTTKDGLLTKCKQCFNGIMNKYIEENREKVRNRKRRYRKNNPEIIRGYHDQKEFSGNKQVVLARDGYRCCECGITNDEHIETFNRVLCVHHIDGNGSGKENKNNDLDNLVTMCIKCHTRLHAKQRKTNQTYLNHKGKENK